MSQIKSNSVEVRFDCALYSDIAVQKAAHEYSGEFSFKISRAAESNEFICLVRPLETNSLENFSSAIFENRVLDHQLRLRLSDETAPVKNLIIAQAFSKTSLITPDGA